MPNDKSGKRRGKSSAKATGRTPRKPSRRNSKTMTPNDVARFIKNEIKSEKAAPGTPFSMELLRTILKPATDPVILAGLMKLASQGVISQQSENQWVVLSPNN